MPRLLVATRSVFTYKKRSVTKFKALSLLKVWRLTYAVLGKLRNVVENKFVGVA